MRILFSLFFLFSSLVFADGTLNLFILNDGNPYKNLDIEIDAKKRYTTDSKGSLKFLSLMRGKHFAVIYDKNSVVIATIRFRIADEENTQIILRLKENKVSNTNIEEPDSVENDALNKKMTDMKNGVKGYIKGKVVSAEDNKAVSGVKIFVKGFPIEGQTDKNGNYSLTLPEGKFSISLIHADYSSQTINDLIVKGEETTSKNIELTPASLELAEFVVLAPHIEGSIASVIDEKRNSSAVADVLGSEQFSKSGDSDAAGALKRVTGITVVGGKYVYVRGLGERYSNTLMNNLNLSSPEPTKRVVPLDLFPTGVIESMMIQKTFSPDIPATFGGGTILIRTKNIPDAFFLKVSGSTSFIEGTTGETGLSYKGGDTDWLGYDDGGRDLDKELLDKTDGKELSPEILLDLGIPGVDPTVIKEGYSAEDKYRYGKMIARDADTEDQTLYPPVSGSVTFGDRFDIGEEKTLGYLTSISYGHQFDSLVMENQLYRVSPDGGLEQKPGGGEYTITNRDIQLGMLFGLGLNIGDSHRFRTTTFYINKTNDIAQLFNGEDENGNFREKYYLSWVERNLLINQIEGIHKFFDDRVELNWNYGNSVAERTEPQTLSYYFGRDGDDIDGVNTYSTGASDYQYLHSLLEDETDNFRSDLKYKINPFGTEQDSEIKLGYEILKKERSGETRVFTFGKNGDLNSLSEETLSGEISEIINYENVENDVLGSISATFTPEYFYDASQDLTAYYLMTNLFVRDDLSFMFGLRNEASTQELKAGGKTTKIESDDMLPALTGTYKFSEDMQLRFGYGKTLSRPDFREFSDARYTDPETGDSVMGNSELTYTTIDNYDLRFEWYLSELETISMAIFSKDFTNPIETVLDSSDNPIVTYRNATEASLWGVEVDFRKNLEFIHPSLDLYSISGNVAIINSEVKLSEKDKGNLTSNNREMQGQSPYVLNLQTSYDNPDLGTSLNLSYNRFGERIRRLGVGGVPDQYEQPFDQLDFVAIQTLNENWKLKFKLKNILDDEVVWKQDDEITRSYKRGRSWSFGFDWKY
ncbi:outer membrane receptor protein [Thiovulum sp. ES]|nr:outer membrane receptor protein [Thiovulum sp. ES]